jgi:hypothetical protein
LVFSDVSLMYKIVLYCKKFQTLIEEDVT